MFVPSRLHVIFFENGFVTPTKKPSFARVSAVVLRSYVIDIYSAEEHTRLSLKHRVHARSSWNRLDASANFHFESNGVEDVFCAAGRRRPNRALLHLRNVRWPHGACIQRLKRTERNRRRTNTSRTRLWRTGYSRYGRKLLGPITLDHQWRCPVTVPLGGGASNDTAATVNPKTIATRTHHCIIVCAIIVIAHTCHTVYTPVYRYLRDDVGYLCGMRTHVYNGHVQ